MNPNFKAVLLTILTLSVFTLVIIELTGISSNSFNAWWQQHVSAKPGGKGLNTVIDTRSQQVNAMPRTTIKFDESKYDFGKISADSVVKHVFKFHNTGANPLMIARTDVSCGCTVPSYSQAPIAPGAEGEITVSFNPKGKSGAQHKNVMIHSNADPESISIGFDADVH